MSNADEGEPRFEDDPIAVAFVRAHPDNATFEEVAEALGITAGEARRIAKRAIRKLQRAEGAPITYDLGNPVRTGDDAAQADVVAPEPDDAPLREELYSPAGLRLAALADAMDYRLTCVHRLLRYIEVRDTPRKWFGPDQTTWTQERKGFV